MQFKPINDRRIRLAVVGFGRISGNYFDALVRHADRAELTAVCDTAPAALEAAAQRMGASPMPAFIRCWPRHPSMPW